jgi:recombination protein RecA
MAKKKEEEKSKLDLVLEKLNKQYGEGSILGLDSKNHNNYDIIPSGSLGFDYETLGVGGWVKGRLYELMGWEGCGKSTICGHAVAECQKLGGKAAYIDGEHAVDRNYFKQLGVDTSKLLIAQPTYGEEGFQIAMELINSGEIDLIIIDSDSSLIPKKVLDGEVGDSSIGRKASLNSNAYPKLKGALSANNVCVIVISQYREKIGVMFGNPTTTQGGHALKFYSDVRLEVSKSVLKDGEVSVANKTKVKSTKNKMAPPFRTCEFNIVYGEGIDVFTEVLEMAVDADIIKRSGSWFSYGETRIGQGIDSVKNMFKDNPELFDEVKQKLIDNLTALSQEEINEIVVNDPETLIN